MRPTSRADSKASARLPQHIAALGHLRGRPRRFDDRADHADGVAGRLPALLRDVADELADVADLDLTVECITHRFTPSSETFCRAGIRTRSWRWTKPVRTRQVR